MESDSKLRLLRLLELLQTESDELNPISIAQITAMMKERWGIEAYRTTIQKDVEALHAAGYEIETIRSTQNRYYLTSRTFELPELKLLLDAVESSKFITQKKSRILASKLLSLTSRHTAVGLKRNISIADRIKPHNEHIYYYIDVINEAINMRRKISFRYFAYTSSKKKALKNDGIPYVLSPYTLTWNGDCYYVVGWSDKHGKVATFRVDRIFETPEILAEKAVVKPKEYSIADFAEKAFQLFDADRTKVTLLCDAAAMNSVIDHFGDQAKTTPIDDSTFRLVAEVSLSPTFFAWVFQFGGKVKILKPIEAIEKYRALLQAGMS